MDANFLKDIMGNALTDLVIQALIVNFITAGARMGYLAIKKAIHVSPIPITFVITEETTVFNVVTSILMASIVSVTANQLSVPWYVFVKNASILWLASLFTWSVGIKQLVTIVPAMLDAMIKKLNDISGLNVPKIGGNQDA